MGEAGDTRGIGSSGLVFGKTLAVVLHGWGRGPRSMDEVCILVREAYGPTVRVHAPVLPYSRRFHSVRATAVVLHVLESIDQLIAEEGSFDRIVLMGHSLGATIARRVHLVALAPSPAGFRGEAALDRREPRPWAHLVERIVLIAAV